MAGIKRTKLADLLVKEILEDIKKGKYKPGVRYPRLVT